ncbi:MAG: lmo0937 family membrane protein [Bacteroidia bacterium]|nr:lmo0937 family membrane protein [Bacteroidia bacterium]MCF8426629.1 lmo0937 family membrane protein [Bacteroidia bacterium]MCF8446933.1 lmo0937 family membrane protein [Bacteroidia bacterium]
MSNLLYTIAIIAIILWLVGYFGFHFGGLIHLLIVIALISVILRIIKGDKAL